MPCLQTPHLQTRSFQIGITVASGLNPFQKVFIHSFPKFNAEKDPLKKVDWVFTAELLYFLWPAEIKHKTSHKSKVRLNFRTVTSVCVI